MNKRTNKQHFWQKNLFFVIALLVALMITWKIIDQANHNYKLHQQAAEIQARIDLLNQQRKNQALDNEFLRSDYYLDLAIREQKGELLPGESVYVIDRSEINQRRDSYRPQGETEEEPEIEYTNLEKWWNFIWGINSPGSN